MKVAGFVDESFRSDMNRLLAILLYHSCNLNLIADFCFVDYNTETLRMILDFIHTGGIVIDPSQKKILKQMKELLQCLNIKVNIFTYIDFC